MQFAVKSHLGNTVKIPAGGVFLDGELVVPETANGLVLFVHGGGSSRHSPRNQYIARVLRHNAKATLLFDLLTDKEEGDDIFTGQYRFDVNFLARRLAEVTAWVHCLDETKHLPIGYFGASTGGAAALIAAADLGSHIKAVVSRGGRPDLAGNSLKRVTTPTLLVVGGRDELVIEMNKEAFGQLRCTKELRIIPGATHLFEEPGTLQEVARLATAWYQEYLHTPYHM